ncbi:hypothetical protein Sj15T_10060 [Sphingobium sp. TA15]|nr:hypothetical protein Sj15T_10060 [Sphingobium sp. TA15]
MVGNQPVGFCDTALIGIDSGKGTICLAIDRDHAMLEPLQIRQAISLYSESMAKNALWEDAVEMLEDGDKTFRPENLSSANAANSDDGARLHGLPECIDAAFIVSGQTALDDWHKAVEDTEIGGAHPAVAVRADCARYSVKHFLAIPCNGFLATIVEAREAAKRIAGGERHIFIHAPRYSVVPDHC